MKKFLLGILCGFVFAAVALVIVGFAVARLAGGGEADEPSEGFLQLRLEGAIAEHPADEIPIPWLNSQMPWTVIEVKQILERAATDNKIKGLFLEIGGADFGWGKAAEIRAALAAFRKSGKPVHAFLRQPNARDYFLSSACDRISMVEEDLLDLKGLRVERTYFKNTLDKLGVEMEILHAGKYKDFGDSFTKTSMSPESRESLGAILNGIYGVLVNGIAQGRKRSPAEIEKLMDDGPFLAKAALREKLIDALEYDSAARAKLAEKTHVASTAAISAREYRKKIRHQWQRDSDAKVAFLVAEGDILRGSELGEGVIASRDFIHHVSELKKDPEFKAVLLRIDSPGGDAIASDELLAALRDLSKVKPLVVSMSDVAASGGYYMAVTGDPIFAYPGTITGSIGVVYGRPNLKGLYDKIGLTKDGMQKGKNADLDVEYRPLSDTARRKLREGIDESYSTFLSRVADGRKAKVSDIEPLAQGRAWVASDPAAKRLTDQIGGIDAALQELIKRAKLPAEAKPELIPYPPLENAISKLFTDEEHLLSSLGPTLGLAQPPWANPIARNLKPALRPALLRGGMLRWMPYQIDVR
ncbi:MAG: signal peptide peptidase SppA [Acidobacteriota bacterium]